MKKLFFIFNFLFFILLATQSHAYQVLSSKELGQGDAKNQNIVVKCTTDTGKISTQTCTLRRYAKCTNGGCSGWQPWRDLANPGTQYTDWKAGAATCCQAKGLR